MVKQSLEKRLKRKRGTKIKPPTLLESIPAAHFVSSGKSPGNPVVELATPNGTNNQAEGTNKNEL